MRNLEATAAPGDPASASVYDPVFAPFSGFLERDELRQKRDRSRRRTLVISLGIHVVAVAIVVAYSVFQVDELFGPTVGVKIMSRAKLPPGVVTGDTSPRPAVVPR